MLLAARAVLLATAHCSRLRWQRSDWARGVPVPASASGAAAATISLHRRRLEVHQWQTILRRGLVRWQFHLSHWLR